MILTCGADGGSCACYVCGTDYRDGISERSFYHPAHPYTKALLDTVPGIYDESGRTLASIPGIVPENYEQITGCRFADRCAFAGEGCVEKQEMKEIEKDHFVRCHKACRS